MLDDAKVIDQRDPKKALEVAGNEWQQLLRNFVVENTTKKITPHTLVVAGMGGSALAASMIKDWLNLPIPFEIIKTYSLPDYVDKNTLFIASSYSGNTEETISALEDARQRGAAIIVVASGGRLVELARQYSYPFVVVPASLEPRMAVFYSLRAMTKILSEYGLAVAAYDELAEIASWLREEAMHWGAAIPTELNYAKQLALKAVGKTPVMYAGYAMRSVAYKWKISFNENAKNIAFWNELPEFNHNEFIGWTSHPVEKPYAVFDLVSSFDHPRIQKRFTVSAAALSGKRPQAITVQLQGSTPLGHMLWGSMLGDFISIYTAILNNVDPTPVEAIEKFKKALVA